MNIETEIKTLLNQQCVQRPLEEIMEECYKMVYRYYDDNRLKYNENNWNWTNIRELLYAIFDDKLADIHDDIYRKYKTK